MSPFPIDAGRENDQNRGMVPVRDLSNNLIGKEAVRALRDEAGLAPKPGLVDPFHSGAHDDMDYPVLLASAEALGPCFAACAAAGRAFAGSGRTDFPALLPLLRPIGLEGEAAMYRATGGVNVHKGAIFCLGLLSAALGILTPEKGRSLPTAGRSLGDEACHLVGELCSGLVTKELEARLPPPGERSAGERLFAKHGFRGARGQAEDGYPLLRTEILPRLRSSGEPGVEVLLDALLAAMSHLEDSCVLSRGGLEGLAFVRTGAAEALRAGPLKSEARHAALRELDRAFCERRLSPGGSADLLAAGLFLTRVERLTQPSF